MPSALELLQAARAYKALSGAPSRPVTGTMLDLEAQLLALRAIRAERGLNASEEATLRRVASTLKLELQGIGAEDPLKLREELNASPSV